MKQNIASDIKLVFHSSTITMMHGPINIRFLITVRSSAKNADGCIKAN